MFENSRMYRRFKKNTGYNITYQQYSVILGGVKGNAKRTNKKLTSGEINKRIANSIENAYYKLEKKMEKESYLRSFSSTYGDEGQLKKDILNRAFESKNWRKELQNSYLDEYTELGSSRINQIGNIAKRVSQLNIPEYQDMSEEEIAEELKKLSADQYSTLLGNLGSAEDIYEIMAYDSQYSSYEDYIADYHRRHSR